MLNIASKKGGVAPDWGRYSALLILGVLAFRIITLIASPVQLHGDEAQYWSWSRDLDFGYFSKPPMIAWLIWATTSLFGQAEWAVRLSSPLIHAATASLLYLIGRDVFNRQSGFWAAAIYTLMPAVFLSSGIVSTDVGLLFFWALALLGLVKLRQKPSPIAALCLGAAIGLGLLSKYAMLFFLPALIITLIIDKPARKALFSAYGLGAFALAAIIFSPNIIWNLQHDFATVSHTASNSNLGAEQLFNVSELLKFWGDQLGVFGPITFIMLIIAILAAWRGKIEPNAKWLSLFILSPLIIISTQAFISRANANWAVSGYIAAALVLGHYITAQLSARKWGIGSIALNCLLGLSIVTLALLPNLADALGQANAFKRTRAWDETAQRLSRVAHEHGAIIVAVDNRLIFYDLTYYGPEADLPPLRIWMEYQQPHNHAEATSALTPHDLGPILIASQSANNQPIYTKEFDSLSALGELKIDLGGGKTRVLHLFIAKGYKGKSP